MNGFVEGYDSAKSGAEIWAGKCIGHISEAEGADRLDLHVAMKLPDPSLLTEQKTAQLTASLEGLAPEKRPLLARDTLETARTALRAPVRARESTILKQLRQVRKTAATRPVTADEISDDLCPALGVDDLSELADLLASPEEFVRVLDAAIAESASKPETVQDRRGGRRRDPRIDNFAHRLAAIHEEYTGERPTFTQDKEKGWAISAFGLFAYEAFCLFFCPYVAAGEGQIREALRDAVALERDYEILPEDELDELVPKEPKSGLGVPGFVESLTSDVGDRHLILRPLAETNGETTTSRLQPLENGPASSGRWSPRARPPPCP